MNDAHRPTPAAPQVRTLLLTDLVDSTTLVERLGDAQAAELFREHDRLVLDLQQRWRGRLIDRSDGMLLLFERPIDGLAFALDYARGLRAIGETRKVELRARAGLHVGEVLTWHNSAEAVQAGAKPLEVEGLAKPLAGRLMTLARPGQILLSATAEPLARRAARELGERGEHLIWKSYGRWRLKGMPDSQEIFEVGEPGHAPLRAPNHTPKAWRDIPLWRRPVALAAEVLLLAGLGTGLWFITKPQPAIAFGERDWVVVGDLRNLTGDPRFDDALEAALRISLEQSRYVNVMPDMRVRDTLQLMRRDPARAVVDRALGSEIATRTGARALLLPTVAEVRGRVQVSVEVVDPLTQATVYANSAAGRGADSAVASVGRVSTAMREDLGEALVTIQATSAPLEKVTTPDLDALRAFTLGQEAYARQRLPEAEQHFRQALAIDPGFAMARIGLSRIAFVKTDVPTALREMETAVAGLDRLTDRERLYATAQLAMVRWDRDWIEKWTALARLYPDFHVAAFNASNGMRYANRYREMHAYSDATTATQAITRPAGVHHRAVAAAALGRLADAERDFRLAEQLGFRAGFVEPALHQAAMRRFDKASALLSANGAGSHGGVETTMADITFAADAGRWDEAARKARVLGESVAEPRLPFDWTARAVILAVQKRTLPASRVQQEARGLIDLATRALPAVQGRAREAVANAALFAGYVAAGAGDRGSARRALALAEPVIATAPRPVLANHAAIVRARLALQDDKPAKALEALAPYRSASALALTERVAEEARTALGGNAPEARDAKDRPEWRARAYQEWASERPPVIEALAGR